MKALRSFTKLYVVIWVAMSLIVVGKAYQTLRLLNRSPEHQRL